MIQASLPCTNIFLRPSVTCSNHQQKKVICQDCTRFLHYFTRILLFYLWGGWYMYVYIYIYKSFLNMYLYTVYFFCPVTSSGNQAPFGPPKFCQVRERLEAVWVRRLHIGTRCAHCVRLPWCCHGSCGSALFQRKGQCDRVVNCEL